MEHSKEKLCAVARDLFMNHKVAHEEMFKWIRDTINDAVANLPKDRVLYNSCYGAYGVSEEFLEFVDLEDLDEESKEFRVKATALIRPFADWVLSKEKYTGLRDCLFAYRRSELHKVRRELETVYRSRCRLANLAVNIPALEEYLSNPHHNVHVVAHPAFPRATVEYLGADRPNTWFCSYTRQNLEDILRTAQDGSFQRALADEIRTAEEAALKHVSRDTLEDFVAHLGEIREVKTQKNKSFITLLNERGYNDPVVWKSQDRYKFDVITYIVKRGIASEVATTDLVAIEEEFGLLCASAEQGSKLDIAEVSHGMSWRIREYDGRETVYVV